MVEQHRLKKIGDSRFFLVPYEYIKVHNLNNYVYYLEVSQNGKEIKFTRMREDEKLKKEDSNITEKIEGGI